MTGYNIRWRFWSAPRKREAFDAQIATVKVVLFRWLEWEYGRQAIPSPVPPSVVAGQVVNFLTGCDPDDIQPGTAVEHVDQILALKEYVPDLAYRTMDQDAGLREIVVNTAREYRLVGRETSSDFAQSATDTRLADFERRYGHEFPRHISRSEYVYLITNLLEWANGPEFPPTAEKTGRSWDPPSP